MMKWSLLGFAGLLLLTFFPDRMEAQFAYGPPALGEQGIFDGFRTDRSGNFTPLAGSPFGGVGGFGSMVANLKSNFLYLYDSDASGTGGIQSYKIDKVGQPAAVGSRLPYTPPSAPGSDFTFASLGMMSRSGKYVYILNTSTDDEGFGAVTKLTFLRVQKDGSVTYNPKEVYDFGDGIQFMTGDPSGKFLFGQDGEQVLGFSVAADGSLKALAGPPQPPGAVPGTIGFSPRGNYFYEFFNINYNQPGQLAVFSFGSDGTLTPIPGSPFSDPQGRFNCISQLVLHPDGKFAYALGYIPGITTTSIVGVYAYKIENNGQLTPIKGSPYWLATSYAVAFNLVMNPKGSFLTVNDVGYGTEMENWVFEIHSDGTLTERANSPSATIPPIACFVGNQ